MRTIALPWLLRSLQRIDFPGKLGLCERLFGRKLSHLGICWSETGAGLAWKLDLANPTLRWIVYGKYAGPSFLNWAARYLPRDGVIVDSGANIGQMLVYLSQMVPAGKVLAFEPCHHSADWLQECLAAHPTLPVELIRLGLSETSGEARLAHLGTANLHGSWNQVSLDPVVGGSSEIISLGSLDRIIAEKKHPLIHLWKLDVEGHEPAALRGAEELLRAHRIRALYIELAFDQGMEVRRYLHGLGYQAYHFSRWGRLIPISLTTPLPDHTDALFLASDI